MNSNDSKFESHYFDHESVCTMKFEYIIGNLKTLEKKSKPQYVRKNLDDLTLQAALKGLWWYQLQKGGDFSP